MAEDKQEMAEERTERAKERTERAEERTEWADQRTYLAQQRTFAGWIRTGLGSMAVGFGIVQFVKTARPAWLISAIGLILFIAGGSMVGIAFISYRKVTTRLSDTDKPEANISLKWVGAISAGLILCSIGGVIYVLL